jgi:hypothetical protein
MAARVIGVCVVGLLVGLTAAFVGLPPAPAGLVGLLAVAVIVDAMIWLSLTRR